MRVLPDGAGVSVTTDSGVHAVLQALQTDSLQIEARCGECEPDGGWIATSYGCKQPAPVIRFHGQVQFPYSMTFLLSSSHKMPVPIINHEMKIVSNSAEVFCDTAKSRY